ncbi:unnamed protein product [Prorocentrum cordatum]|uniref:Phospholipase B-like n=1 Tax=Prorocentrum cordatum TaxID=2364126 RepID=A0ABN9TN18_9DINO|nr:unnamed protein product [Polarella glacialis]
MAAFAAVASDCDSDPSRRPPKAAAAGEWQRTAAALGALCAVGCVAARPAFGGRLLLLELERSRSPARHRRARRLRAGARAMLRCAAARKRLAVHHGDRPSDADGRTAQPSPRQATSGAGQGLVWACTAKRLCGVRNNFASRGEGLRCGRERAGRQREGSADQVAASLAEALATVDRLRQQQAACAAEVATLEAEVVAAQRAVAASAAGSSGVDLANLATTLVGLQALLSAAPARVASGTASTPGAGQASASAPAARAPAAPMPGAAPPPPPALLEAWASSSDGTATSPPGSFDVAPSFTFACHAYFGIRGGLILASADFEVGQWDNGGNASAGDFNCDPPRMDVGGFLDFMRARVAARLSLNVGARRSAQGNYSNVDFWLASPSVAGSLAPPRLVQGWPAAPRFLAATRLGALAKAVKFPLLVGPKSSPKAAPDDEAAAAPGANQQQVIDCDGAPGCEAMAHPAQVRLDDLHSAFMRAAEEELIAHHGTPDADDDLRGFNAPLEHQSGAAPDPGALPGPGPLYVGPAVPGTSSGTPLGELEREPGPLYGVSIVPGASSGPPLGELERWPGPLYVALQCLPRALARLSGSSDAPVEGRPVGAAAETASGRADAHDAEFGVGWPVDTLDLPSLRGSGPRGGVHGVAGGVQLQELLPGAGLADAVPNDFWGIHDLLLVGYRAHFMNEGSAGKAAVQAAAVDLAALLPQVHPVPECRAQIGSALAAAAGGRESVVAAAQAAWDCLPGRFGPEAFDAGNDGGAAFVPDGNDRRRRRLGPRRGELGPRPEAQGHQHPGYLPQQPMAQDLLLLGFPARHGPPR